MKIDIPSLPSAHVLQEIGKAIVLFSQVEHYLLVAYKRAKKGAKLPDIVKKRGRDPLGGLLHGVSSGKGKKKPKFKGLLHLRYPRLRLIRPQLEQVAYKLLPTRNRYVHRGIARRIPDGVWVFIKSRNETSEAEVVKELEHVSNEIETLIAQIHHKLPPPK